MFLSTLALPGGCLSFSSGHLRHSHWPQVLATPREARGSQVLPHTPPSMGQPWVHLALANTLEGGAGLALGHR